MTCLQGGASETLRRPDRDLRGAALRGPALLPDLSAAARGEARRFAMPLTRRQCPREPHAGRPAVERAGHGDFLITDFVVADCPAWPIRHAPLERPNVLTVYAPLVGPAAPRAAELSGGCYGSGFWPI